MNARLFAGLVLGLIQQFSRFASRQSDLIVNDSPGGTGMKIAGIFDTSVTGSEKTVYFAFSYRDLLWLVLVQFVSFESQETSRPFTSGSTPPPPFYGLQHVNFRKLRRKLQTP